MKAVLLVPETKRIGLTGKPILNQEGIVGSLKGSFQAGQRVTLINLKGITQKIAEAQAAMSGAETNIHRSGETIDDIQNGSNEMGSVIDYWERWDRKGVHDRAANIQFLATSVAMDKVRTAMLGESVDPVNLTNDTFPQVYIPRGMYWDPIFSWQKHSLEFNKNSNFVSAYSTRAWMVQSIKSLSSLITGALLNVAKLTGYFTIVLNQSRLELIASELILETIISPWMGEVTKANCMSAAADILSALGVDKTTLETKTIVTVAIIGILNILTAMLGVLISQVKSYGHVELMGNNPSQYLNAPIRRNVDREQWYTYAFIDQLVDASMSAASAILDNIAMIAITNEIKEVAQIYAGLAALKIAVSMPDIPSVDGPQPNLVGIAAANLAASLIKKATADDTRQLVYLTVSIVPAIASVVVNMAKAFTFITTRTNLDSNIPLNSNSISTSAGKPGKKYNSLNEIGNMDAIPIDNWTSSIAKMSGSLGAISMAGSQFTGAIAGAAGFAREATSSAVIAGGPTRYDTYIMSDMNETYVDWSGNYYRRENTGRNLVCWSHVFNENLFGIKSSQIGGRKIEKTIVIKTKVLGNTDSTIYCFQALCKCVGESNLHLLFERDAVITKRMNNKERYPVTLVDIFHKNTGEHAKYYTTAFNNRPVGYSYEVNGEIETVLWKGYGQQNGASYNKREQIIWNFDPENTGDFFTGDRNGKYSEMFEIDSNSGTTTYYNLDGSFYDSKTNTGYTQRSYRPNMEWKYNKLMGEVINTEVTGYDKFMNIPSNYRDRSTSSGDITSYENVYR